MRILVIEDDKELNNFLKTSFEEELFIVDVADDGEKGSYMARTNEYDMIILDIALPEKTGIEVCKEVRAAGKNVPIMMLTANMEIISKIELLDLGADDYLTKPFSFKELMARVRAITRRPKKIESNIIRIDDLLLNRNKSTVYRGGKTEIYLTRKEFVLLEYLMSNKELVLSRGMIMEHVWDNEADPFSNTIETHILNLRKKIDFAGKKKLIKTISGRGYKIEG